MRPAYVGSGFGISTGAGQPRRALVKLHDVDLAHRHAQRLVRRGLLVFGLLVGPVSVVVWGLVGSIQTGGIQ
jgi:hypothetical protein